MKDLKRKVERLLEEVNIAFDLEEEAKEKMSLSTWNHLMGRKNVLEELLQWKEEVDDLF